MKRLSHRLVVAALQLGWHGGVPALLCASFYSNVLAGTPASWLGSFRYESLRRAWLLWIVFSALVLMSVYWRGVLQRPRLPAGLGAQRFIWPAVLGIALAGLASAVALFWRSAETYRVQGLAMLPALKTGDELRIQPRRFSSRSLPKRGELVRFQTPRHFEPSENVLRVIGLPGDRIEVRAGFAFINGWQVPTCDVGRYFRWGSEGETNGRVFMEFLGKETYLTVHEPLAAAHPEYFVPVGEVYLLGDNRSHARDSRTWRHGKASGLPLASVGGTVQRVLLSKGWGEQLELSASSYLPGFALNLPGVDQTELKQGIDACLQARPAITDPPAATSLVPVPPTSAASL